MMRCSNAPLYVFSITFPYVGLRRCKRPLSGRCNFSFYIFKRRTLMLERMIMLMPEGSVLCSITLHILNYSAVSTEGNKEAAAKGMERWSVFHRLSL